MKIHYKLNEKDFLQHLLYLASVSKRIQSKRKKNYLWVNVVFIVVAVFALVVQNNFLAIISLIMTVITALFYPIYERKHYKNYYWEFIKENYPDKKSESSILEFKEHELIIQDKNAETRLGYSNIDSIVEIQDYFYIRIGATSLIIPTNRIEHSEAVRERLISIAKNQQKEYASKLNWKWK